MITSGRKTREQGCFLIVSVYALRVYITFFFNGLNSKSGIFTGKIKDIKVCVESLKIRVLIYFR